jgi:hypothetical protein
VLARKPLLVEQHFADIFLFARTKVNYDSSSSSSSSSLNTRALVEKRPYSPTLLLLLAKLASAGSFRQDTQDWQMLAVRPLDVCRARQTRRKRSEQNHLRRQFLTQWLVRVSADSRRLMCDVSDAHRREAINLT